MPTRYISRPTKACKAPTSSLHEGRNILPEAQKQIGQVYLHGMTGSIVLDCQACGRPHYVRMVKGKYSATHTCGARCLASTGPSCECSCGGRNHGAGYDPTH